MTKTFLLIASILLLGKLSAQDKIMDSLQVNLKAATSDSSKVNSLNDISRQYYETGNYPKAIEYGNQALSLSQKTEYKKGEAAAYVSLGWVYEDQANFPLALKSYNSSLTITQQIGDKRGITSSYIGVGNIYYELGNYPDALKNYLSALRIGEETGNKKQTAVLYYDIGNVYRKESNYPEALKNYGIARKLYEELKNNNGIAFCYLVIGVIYNEEGNYPEALTNYLAALKLAKETGNRNTMAFAYSDIGEAYTHMEKYNEALKNYADALDITRELGDKNGIARCYISLALLNVKMGKNAEARKYLDDALLLSKEIGSKERIKEAYSTMAILDSAAGNWKDAYKDHKLFMLYRDSLVNEENTKKTVQASMQYEFDKKEALAKEQQAAKDARQRFIRNSIAGGLILVLIFAIVVSKQRNKIAKGKKRSDHLLLNILPAETAEELKTTGSAKAKSYEKVTVLFTDFKDFTGLSEKLSAEELVDEIHNCYSNFDKIIGYYGIEKIKTIGDSYMCASGLPEKNETHASDMVKAALEMQQYMQKLKEERQKNDKPFFDMRIGINSGPVVAGIVGLTKFAYDIWGDTVNIASRMEAGGVEGKVNISGSTYELVKNEFICQYRGKVITKGKGEVDMYFVEGFSEPQV
jgi:adenylate cyclase